jgi:hypothetical protein
MKLHKITIPKAGGGSIQLRLPEKHVAAIEEIKKMKSFEGIKTLDLLAEVYHRGKKEGAREVFDGIELLK